MLRNCCPSVVNTCNSSFVLKMIFRRTSAVRNFSDAQCFKVLLFLFIGASCAAAAIDFVLISAEIDFSSNLCHLVALAQIAVCFNFVEIILLGLKSQVSKVQC